MQNYFHGLNKRCARVRAAVCSSFVASLKMQTKERGGKLCFVGITRNVHSYCSFLFAEKTMKKKIPSRGLPGTQFFQSVVAQFKRFYYTT